jgi:hypothetical protein
LMRLGVKRGQPGWRFDELADSWKAAEVAVLDTVS